METKRLSTEVLNRLSEIKDFVQKEPNSGVMKEFTTEVFHQLLDEGYDILISKTDINMLYSLNIDQFLKGIDQVLKNSAAPTPL